MFLNGTIVMLIFAKVYRRTNLSNNVILTSFTMIYSHFHKIRFCVCCPVAINPTVLAIK